MESGILELYVLGDVTPEEKLQVEGMIAAHPVVKIEVDAVERAMERYAMEYAIEPAEKLRDRILSSTVTNLGDDRNFQPAKSQHDNVVNMSASQPTNFYKYAFAASLALLVAATSALYNVNNKLEQSNQQLLALSTKNQQFAKTVNLKDEQLSVFRDTAFKMVRLKGTPKAPDAAMAIAWNPVNKKVMIDMAAMNMPKNDDQHQYQLWAIVGGKPVDLGVFDKTAADTTDMKEMKSVALAQAFAVTLEPRGGSVNPTMDQMMVIKML
ncbi:anti-sigma factor [Mucilaginibacter sp.]